VRHRLDQPPIRGTNGPAWTIDAIDFCRAIARRPASSTLDELMNTEVPY